jgi:uncharacterized damage-inducible protein DinB
VPATSRERHPVVAAWLTNNDATVYLVRHLPAAVWTQNVPGIPRKTIGMIAAHIHNSRCMWIKSIGAAHGVAVPKRVDLRRGRQAEVVQALPRSSNGMVDLIELGIAHGGRVPPGFWQNFPTDLEHFLSYFAAHEGHHRGQLIMAVRQLGHRLPPEIVDGVWQWKKLAREAGR